MFQSNRSQIEKNTTFSSSNLYTVRCYYGPAGLIFFTYKGLSEMSGKSARLEDQGREFRLVACLDSFNSNLFS